jgi:hypothetical protein
MCLASNTHCKIPAALLLTTYNYQGLLLYLMDKILNLFYGLLYGICYT